MSHYRQPPLHELVTVLRAPAVCLSAPDGQVGTDALTGFYDSDRRVVAHLELEVADAKTLPVGRRLHGATEAVFTAQVRPDCAPDTSVLLHRRRAVRAYGLTERLEFVSVAGATPVTVRLLVRCATDLAPVHVVRDAARPELVAPSPTPSGARWSAGGQMVMLTADHRPDEVRATDGVAVLAFTLTLDPAEPVTLTLRVCCGTTASAADDPGTTAAHTRDATRTDQPGADQPGADKPRTVQPGADEPNARAAGAPSATVSLNSASSPTRLSSADSPRSPGPRSAPALLTSADSPGSPAPDSHSPRPLHPTSSPSPLGSPNSLGSLGLSRSLGSVSRRDVHPTVPPPGESFLPRPTDAPPVLAGSLPCGVRPPNDPLRRRLLEVSVADLEAMLLVDPQDPRDIFAAAGSPWYFTLFGRDALWTASLLLPLGTQVAAGTLRTLARRQGVRSDPGAEEQPGKILHEVRRETLRVGELVIPPVYFGSVDATLLWVRLLHDAWRAGMAEAEVEALLPRLWTALHWITEYGDVDGDGLVEYRPSGRGGLAHQAWKDSPDAVCWADGRSATAPLAPCEVQGYAYAAAMQGADLMDAFAAPDADRWRGWAARLRERFRESFWISDPAGDYPAIALDAAKRPVDGAASNMAHLLGTGLLTSREAALVARRLARPDLDCGYGLRTLSADCAAFDPLSYHRGSVWPHDTAIAVLGLAAEGQHTVARSLAEGLLAAAPHFDFRLPELYGGLAVRHGEPLLAYPTACRPQAWAAAGAVAVLGYLEGWPLG